MKLPPKAAWNIVTALYAIISQALYTVVHPIKGLNSLAKSTAFLLNELTKPETWTKIGTGSIGMFTAQGMILGGPFSLIGIGIGGALIAGGISVDTLSIVFQSETGKGLDVFLDKVKMYAKQLPEAFLTGVFTGLLIGGIRRAFSNSQPQRFVDTQSTENIPTENIQPPAKEIKINAQATFEKIPDVAEYKWADWNNLVKVEEGITLDQAKAIASDSAEINYFFFTKGLQMVLEDPNWDLNNLKIFHYGDVAFFSGEPWWGTAPGLADGYIKI